jgi:glycosyltransferase involved in cell wall biosynthesis
VKILHILGSNKFSGAENMACQIIDIFTNEIEMAYCCPDGSISEALLERNIKFIPLNKLSIREIKKVIKDYNPDIIHAHDIRASVISAHCSQETPVISHIHGKMAEMSKLSIKSLIYFLYLRKISSVIVVSKSILEEYFFKSNIEKRATVLYNIVDRTKLINKIQNNNCESDYDYVGVYVGRFVHEKNPQRLIRIISQIVKKLPYAKFALIGEGFLLNEAKKLAEDLNIKNNIKFYGFLNNPYIILGSAKIMLMSSRTEGTPMCVLEAMTLGVPLVSTPVDGIKELIENEFNGFYYEADDKIVDAACKLITDIEFRKTISDRVRNKAIEINNIDNYKCRLMSIYTGLYNFPKGAMK